MTLIEGWRAWWRMWSIRFVAAGTLLVSYIAAVPDAVYLAWSNLPTEFKSFIPQNYLMYISIGLFVIGMFSRVVKQEKLNVECDKQDTSKNGQA
jgi:uncharacterized membrane protein